MIPIVTLEEVKEHLHIYANNQDSDLTLKALAASSFVWTYLKVDFDASPVVFQWTGDIPFIVHAATLCVVADLNNFREGSQVVANFKNWDPLSPAVKSMLSMYRDPTMA